MKANEKSISKLNSNDVENAVLALVALNLTHPEIDDEYGEAAGQILEDYCPLLRVSDEVLTPEERKAADAMRETIQSKAFKMEKKLRSSKDPLFRALVGMQRTTAE